MTLFLLGNSALLGVCVPDADWIKDDREGLLYVMPHLQYFL